MANHEELISQFSDVTGVEPERAQFYLESSAWQLEVALTSFYENDEPVPSEDEPLTDAARRDHIEDISESMSEHMSEAMSEHISESGITEGKSSKNQGKAVSKPKFKTLGDLQNKDSSSEDEEGQAFYAGGSENSGQQVLGPGKKKDIVGDMFKSCQAHSIALESKAGGQQRPQTFGGTGYKLGQTVSDTEGSEQQSSSNGNMGVVLLKLWRDGFTVNDGELKPYSDPENRQFLAAIKRGEIPPEIRQEIHTPEVRLDMEFRRHEEYVPPKPKVKAFTGKGHMLGSPSPATVGMTIPADPSDQAANEAQARTQLNLDQSQPITTLQIRLADGSSVRAQFNLSHTLDDLRRFITTMRPQYALREFSLLTMYPTTELTENKTIEEAGLQNSSIIQRLK